MDNRVPCKNNNCKNTVIDSHIEKTDGFCMSCYQAIKYREEEEFIRKNIKNVNLYNGIEDLVEILKIMYSPREYDRLINYIDYPKTQEEIFQCLTDKDVIRLKEYVIQVIYDNNFDTAEEILSRLVWLTNSPIDDCLELLITKSHYHPGILFKGASPTIRDYLIKQIEKDPDKRVHILHALSWIGDTNVINLFSQWHKSQPIWKSQLDIPPEEYAYEAGWTLTDDGKRRDLIYNKCYPFLPKTSSDKEILSIFTSHEDNCPWCNSRLTVLFDFDLTSPMFQFFNFTGTRLRIATCHFCTRNYPIYTKIDFNGLSKWHYASAYESDYLQYLSDFKKYTLEVITPLTIDQTPRALYHADHWTYKTSGSQIGGHPIWILDAEYPVCPECLNNMKFLGQLDCSDFTKYSKGIFYAFICEECNVAATDFLKRSCFRYRKY